MENTVPTPRLQTPLGRRTPLDIRNIITSYGIVLLLIGFFVFLAIDEQSAFLTQTNLTNIIGTWIAGSTT